MNQLLEQKEQAAKMVINREITAKQYIALLFYYDKKIKNLENDSERKK